MRDITTLLDIETTSVRLRRARLHWWALLAEHSFESGLKRLDFSVPSSIASIAIWHKRYMARHHGKPFPTENILQGSSLPMTIGVHSGSIYATTTLVAEAVTREPISEISHYDLLAEHAVRAHHRTRLVSCGT